MTWQPIESAPKDGTRFIASLVCASSGKRWVAADVSWHRNHWCSDGDGCVDATHWQPLPEPPEPDHATP
jgi:hypothetical protein